MLALDVIDRRTMWRDYWIEWVLAAIFIALFVVAQWQVAAWDGAPVHFANVAPAILVGIVCFPIAAFIAGAARPLEAGAMKPRNYTGAHQSLTFSRRMMLVGGAQVALGAALIARLGYLSISQNEHYKLLSESNRVQLIVVPPRRGWLVDRHGKPIAINRSDFRVDIIPEQLERPTETLRLLAQLLELPTDDVDRIIKELQRRQGLPAGPGRRECALRAICRGHRPPARTARRPADARLLALLPDRPRGRPSGRLCRRRLGQGI